MKKDRRRVTRDGSMKQNPTKETRTLLFNNIVSGGFIGKKISRSVAESLQSTDGRNEKTVFGWTVHFTDQYGFTERYLADGKLFTEGGRGYEFVKFLPSITNFMAKPNWEDELEKLHAEYRKISRAKCKEKKRMKQKIGGEQHQHQQAAAQQTTAVERMIKCFKDCEKEIGGERVKDLCMAMCS